LKLHSKNKNFPTFWLQINKICPKRKKLSMTVGLNPQLSKLAINEWFGIGRLACPIVGESEPSPKLVPF
jgi:hypothetical protein